MHDERDIQATLDAFGIGDDERASLARMWKYIGPNIGPVFDDFYAGIMAAPQTAAYFENPDLIAHARAKQFDHWERLFSGRFDDDYVASTARIGKAHFQISLPLVDYMSGYAKVSAAIQAMMVRRMTGRLGVSRATSTIKVMNVIQSAISLDTELVMSAFFHEQELERIQAFSEMSKGIDRMSRDDLTYVLGGGAPMPAWFNRLESSYDGLRVRLSQVIGDMGNSAKQAGATAAEVNARADELAERSERQAATLEESVAALQELERTVRGSAELALSAQDASESNRREAEMGADVVRETQEAMQRIESSSTQIGKIVDVIDDISFQTNLLALNAGVEAARAGEAGRGFAVVATEVRELAARASSSAKEIRSLIEESSGHVEQGSVLVGRTGVTLTEILTHVGQVSNLVSDIAGVTKDQAMTMQSVNKGMADLETETQANAGIAAEVNTSSHLMRSRSDAIADRLGQFYLSGTDGPQDADHSSDQEFDQQPPIAAE